MRTERAPSLSVVLAQPLATADDRRHRRGRSRAAALLVVALAGTLVGALAGCAAPASSARSGEVPVVVRDDVTVPKSAAPPPAPLPDLGTLTAIDPLHVVPGLPGLDGLTQLENDDASLGRWRTARITQDTAAYDAPDGAPVGMLPTRTLGDDTVVPVVDARDGWLRVMVAARAALPSQDPALVNGRTAWIRAADTERGGTDWRVSVDRAAQTVTIDDGTAVTTHPVLATGSPSRPTPTVPQFVVTSWEDPGSTTPRVVLLSTQSETMDAYDTRTGTSATAFHTTTLRSRGEVSNGCIRVSDEVMDLLWHRVPAGTLVQIT